MKTYKTISEWISSNPKENDINSSMLRMINRGVVKTIRRDIRKREHELERVVKHFADLDALGIKVNDDQLEALSSLRKGIEESRKEVEANSPKKKLVAAEKKGQKHSLKGKAKRGSRKPKVEAEVK